MPPEKTDRRVNRTRNLLHEALHKLMDTKRYDDITVQDIIDQADVGRSTFYAHFQDKEDLAVSTLLEIMNELNEAVLRSDPQGRHILPTRGLFEHVATNPHVFQSVLHDRGREFFFDKGEEFWTERVEERLLALLPPGHEPPVPVNLIATATAGSVVTMMRWWLQKKCPGSPEQMAEMADRLLLPGIWNALGIEAPAG